MDKQYSYLLLNFLTMLFPVILSFDRRVHFHKQWKFIFPGLLLTGCVFLLWDHLFTVSGVWSFNPRYITGFMIWSLPVEEVLFFLTVPFACIFIYECLNHYIRKDVLQPVSHLVSAALLLLSVTVLLLFYDRVYTCITFGLLAAIVLYVQYVKKAPWLGRFYLAYLVSLVPFYVVNGILTSIPIVVYNDAENMGIRMGTIPFEDHFYSLAMLLMNVLFYEYFRRKPPAIHPLATRPA